MKIHRLGLPAAAVLVAATYLGQNPPPVDLVSAVGIVDYDAVVRDYKEADDRKAALAAKTNELDAILDQRLANIEKQKNDLVALERFSDSWFQAQAQLDVLEHEYKTLGAAYRDMLQRESERQRVEVAELLDRAMQDFATARKLQLVLRRRGPQAGAGGSERRVERALSDVLYAAPALDLTSDFVKFLKGWQPK